MRFPVKLPQFWISYACKKCLLIGLFFMFTLIRRSCPGASCVFLKDNTYVPEHWKGKDYFKTCTFQSNIKVLPSSLYAQRQSTIIFSPLVIIVIIMSILFNSSCYKYVTVTSSTSRRNYIGKAYHIITTLTNCMEEYNGISISSQFLFPFSSYNYSIHFKKFQTTYVFIFHRVFYF